MVRQFQLTFKLRLLKNIFVVVDSSVNDLESFVATTSRKQLKTIQMYKS